MDRLPKTWVLTDDKAGNIAQARGLAEAIGFPYEMKQVETAFPWRCLPPAFWPPGILGQTGNAAVGIKEPWPDLIISCGRHAVGPALEIKRRARGATKAVHIQHPHVRLSRFDLVIIPEHDRTEGPNVLVTSGSIHGLTKERLDLAAKESTIRFEGFPRPLIAVLIGGPNKAYDLDEATVDDMIGRLKTVARTSGGSLLVTASRRTGERLTEKLRKGLAEIPGEFWDGTAPNPYLAYLGLADAVIVTADSVNMISEACSTGKPVYLIPLKLKGNGEGKFARFHKVMMSRGCLHPLTDHLDRQTGKDPGDVTRAVAAVKALFNLPV